MDAAFQFENPILTLFSDIKGVLDPIKNIVILQFGEGSLELSMELRRNLLTVVMNTPSDKVC